MYWSEGFTLTGYLVPGCMEDGAWMLWGNSPVSAVVAVTRYLLDKFSNGSSCFAIANEKLHLETFV